MCKAVAGIRMNVNRGNQSGLLGEGGGPCVLICVGRMCAGGRGLRGMWVLARVRHDEAVQHIETASPGEVV